MKEAEFQTQPEICTYMASLIPATAKRILEPTPGQGNLVRAIEARGFQVEAPADFFQLPKTSRWDAICMNPPFSASFAFGLPDFLEGQGMEVGYHILKQAMNMSEAVIALMPWHVLTRSDVRLRAIKRWGLRSVTSLPRRTFNYARIETCILELQHGYQGDTAFKVYDLLKHRQQPALIF